MRASSIRGPSRPARAASAVGTPVSANVTITVEGAFVNDGEARTLLSLYDDFNPVLQDRGNLADRLAPVSTFTFLVSGLFIGDSFALDYSLTAEASATNDPAGFRIGSADATNTALINVDFVTPGVFFEAASGRNYATAAAATPPRVTRDGAGASGVPARCGGASLRWACNAAPDDARRGRPASTTDRAALARLLR